MHVFILKISQFISFPDLFFFLQNCPNWIRRNTLLCDRIFITLFCTYQKRLTSNTKRLLFHTENYLLDTSKPPYSSSYLPYNYYSKFQQKGQILPNEKKGEKAAKKKNMGSYPSQLSSSHPAPQESQRRHRHPNHRPSRSQSHREEHRGRRRDHLPSRSHSHSNSHSHHREHREDTRHHHHHRTAEEKEKEKDKEAKNKMEGPRGREWETFRTHRRKIGDDGMFFF